MKKNAKLLVLVLALLMMCVSFTGCAELDQMREKHAVWTTEESVDSITYKGAEYKRIDINNIPNPLYNKDTSDIVYVTNPDVPVLLSQSMGEYFNISDDRTFITGWIYNENWAYAEEVLYCKADMYDEIMSEIGDGVEYTKYGFGYYTWDEEQMIDEWTYYYLTEKETDAVNKVIEEVKPVNDSDIPYNSSYLLPLDKVSENEHFGRIAYELYANGTDTYYIVQYSEALDMHTCYKVPEELSEIFEGLEEIVASRSVMNKWV